MPAVLACECMHMHMCTQEFICYLGLLIRSLKTSYLYRMIPSICPIACSHRVWIFSSTACQHACTCRELGFLQIPTNSTICFYQLACAEDHR